MSGRATGPRHLYMHHGCILYACGVISAVRTLNPVVKILMWKRHAERSSRHRVVVEVVVRRRAVVESACSNAARKHSNTIKQKGATPRRSERSWLARSPARRIGGPSGLELVHAVAHEVERRPQVFDAGPVAPMVGLGLCSLAAARATSMASRKWTVGVDGRRPAYVFVRKTA